MIVLDRKKEVGEFVGDMIGHCGEWSNYEAIGIEKNGKIVAGVVIDDYVPNVRCALHCAGVGKLWLTRSFLVLVFNYIFEQLNCKVIVNTVDSTNQASVQFTKHIGFKLVYIVENGCEDGHLYIFEMQKNSCKWIG